MRVIIRTEVIRAARRMNCRLRRPCSYEPLYCLSEPPIVSENEWIKANAKMIRQMGEEIYLDTLLSVLRGVRELVGD